MASIEIYITDYAAVDSADWVTIVAGEESSRWIREQDRDLWASTFANIVVNVFDIHSELLVVMKLKWQA